LASQAKGRGFEARRPLSSIRPQDLVFTVDEAEQLVQSVARGEFEASGVTRVLAAQLMFV
jgi:hypothetical protein